MWNLRRLGYVGWLWLTMVAASVAAAESQPNVLIILADDLGFSDLGCYGSEIATPNLDALAKDGLRFSQFYNTARCWPSRGALMTGYYAQTIRRDTVPGVPSGGRGVRPAWAELMPARLHDLGYRCYHTGKWHIDGKALENGFDHSYMIQDQGRFFGPKVHFEDDVPQPAVEPDTGFYATRVIADHAVQFLKDHAAQHADQPFFHYLAFTCPHFPLHALPEDIAKYQQVYQKGWDVIREARWQKMKKEGLPTSELPPLEQEVGPPYAFPDAIAALGAGEVNRPLPWANLNPVQQAFQAQKMAIHAAMVDRMDQEIGRVLAQIREMGAMENTLILFMSDNGASAEMMIRDDGHDPDAAPGSAKSYLCIGPGWSSACNTPLRRHKTWVHEGGISTPLVVHWPAKLTPAMRGQWRHGPAHLVDIMPTILSVAKGQDVGQWWAVDAPPAPGRSLLPAFASEAALPREELWWCHEENRALRQGDWKIVASGKDAPWELSRIDSDRSEGHNLASEYPDRVREMGARWQAVMDENTRIAAIDAPPPEKPKGKGKGKGRAPAEQ